MRQRAQRTQPAQADQAVEEGYGAADEQGRPALTGTAVVHPVQHHSHVREPEELGQLGEHPGVAADLGPGDASRKMFVEVSRAVALSG